MLLASRDSALTLKFGAKDSNDFALCGYILANVMPAMHDELGRGAVEM